MQVMLIMAYLSWFWAGVSGVIAAWVLGAAPVAAEVLTLDRAYREFLSRGVEFGIVADEVAATAEGVEQARGGLRPRVELGASVTGRNQNVLSSTNPAYTIGQDSYGEGEVNLSLTYPIWDPERTQALSVAQAQLVQAQVEGLVIQNATTRELVVAFLSVAQAQVDIRRAKVVQRARQELGQVVTAQIEAGREDASARDVVLADVAAAGVNLAEAEQRLAEALGQLQRFITSDVTAVDARSMRIGAVNLGRGSQSFTKPNLLRYSPEVQAALAGLTVQSERQTLAAAARKPKVQLLASLEAQNAQGSLFGGGSNIRMGATGVSVSVPIYEGGILKSREREEANRSSAQARRVQQVQDAQIASFKALRLAQNQLAAQRKALERQHAAMSRSVQAERQRLESGRGTEAAMLERSTQRDLVMIDLERASLQQVLLQTEIFALFGAFDPRVVAAAR